MTPSIELDRREQAPLHKEGERTRHAQQVLSQRTRTPRVDLAGQVVRVCFSVQEGRKPKLSFQNHRGCYNKIEFLMYLTPKCHWRIRSFDKAPV